MAEADHGLLGEVGSYNTPKDRHGKYRGGTIGASPAYSFTAHVAEVDVDPETGVVDVKKIWVAHDCGKALSKYVVEGQMEGSAYMGFGEAIMEQHIVDPAHRGVHTGPSLLDYRIPTTLDTPELEALIIEAPDPQGPYGAKEAGEGPLHPSIPAIANAIYDAVGVRMDSLPFSVPAGARRDPAAARKGRGGGAAAAQVTRCQPAEDRLMLRLPQFGVATPTSIEDAAAALAQDNARLVAGGSDILPNLKHRLDDPPLLVSLSRVEGLCVLERERDTLVIGAGMTLTEVSEHPLVTEHFPSLAQAAGQVASPLIRNMGTIGGNVNLDVRCRYVNQSEFGARPSVADASSPRATFATWFPGGEIVWRP